MDEQDAIPGLPSSAVGADSPLSDTTESLSDYSATSRHSVSSSRLSVAPTEAAETPFAFSTGIDTAQQNDTASVAGSDFTATSATSGRSGSRKATGRSRDKRRPSLYDCIAGRVRRGAVGKGLHRHQLSTRPYSAAEYYFDKLRKKTGDEDEDARLYWHRELDSHEPPQSDVLWAVHRYASHVLGRDGELSLRFMDESALLAFGVLLEETFKEELGDTGYLAFLEPSRDGGAKESASEPDAFTDDEVSSDATSSQSTAAEVATKGSRQGQTDVGRRFAREDFLTDDDQEGSA